MQMVTVTLAHPLPASTAQELGIPATGLVPKARVDVPRDAVRRLFTAGLLADTDLDVLLGSAHDVPENPPTYYSDNRPDVPSGTAYVWFQTGTGSDGNGTTIWIEDGT